MGMRQLIFSDRDWSLVEKQLFPAEAFVLALAKPHLRDRRLTYRVEHLVVPDPSDYASVGRAGLTLHKSASARFNRFSAVAAKHGLVPVHIHSHPTGVADFSGYDDRNEKLTSRWLASQGQPLLWSVVWPEGGTPRARLWAASRTHDGELWAGLRPLSTDKQTLEVPSALVRQRAFGNHLRKASAELRIGIVGLGGIGLPVAEQLARCGFSQFVLVDPDVVETSNLNRLPGTRTKDVGKHKVDVASRTIHHAAQGIGGRALVRSFREDVYKAPTSSGAKKALGSCDIILALTDNHLSRIECLRLAFESGAVYLQAGVEILLDKQPYQLLVEISGAEQGRYCPICTKRLDPGQASLEARRYVGGQVWEQALSDGYVSEIPAPAVMSINAMAAGALVLELQRRIAGLGADWDIWQVDFNNGTVRTIQNVERLLNESCAVCGRSD